MKKKLLSLIIMTTMIVSTFTFTINVKADDFANNEDKYMKLCSSGNITSSNQNTCTQFNNYLKKKNANLKNQISETNKSIANTQSSLNTVASQITTISNNISSKEKEINYLQTSIDNLQKDIDKKEVEVKNRMYSQQTYNNSNFYVQYIFGASSFGDMFSRMSTINELTKYDKDLVAGLVKDKKEIQTQQNTIKTAKANLESQKKQQVALQNQYTTLYATQSANLNAQKASAAEVTKATNSLDASLAAFYEAARSSESRGDSSVTGNSALGQAIAQKALSKRGCRYYWGATGPNMFDCSGLVYWAYNAAGKHIGRTTAAGYSVSGMGVSRSQLQAGDVVCFNWGSGVAHIGIMINNSTFVHASGKGSGTLGQYPDQCVKTQSLTGYYAAHASAYRRMY